MTADQIRIQGQPAWSFNGNRLTVLFSWPSCSYWVLKEGKVYHVTAKEFLEKAMI